VFRDNCRVPRSVTVDPFTQAPALSACAFPDGTPAWLDPFWAESSPAFNDTWYSRQFPTPIDQIPLEQMHQLSGDEVLDRAMLADSNTRAWDNITDIGTGKWLLQVCNFNIGWLQQASCSTLAPQWIRVRIKCKSGMAAVPLMRSSLHVSSELLKVLMGSGPENF